MRITESEEYDAILKHTAVTTEESADGEGYRKEESRS